MTCRTSLASPMVKNLPPMQETWVRSLGWEDSLERGMATHSSILTWEIPWTKEPGRLPSRGLQRVGHNWMTFTSHDLQLVEYMHAEWWWYEGTMDTKEPAEERIEAKGKGEKEIYIHLNAEFQRIARRDKKAFLRDQCKEIEENNRIGKTRDLYKKIREKGSQDSRRIG